MNKSFKRVSALTAGLSLFGIAANADALGFSIVAQAGMGFNGAKLDQFVKGEKTSEFKPGIVDTTAKEITLETEDDVKKYNSYISDPQSSTDWNLVDFGLRGSWDFGDEANEMFGAELGIRFFMTKHTVTFKDTVFKSAKVSETKSKNGSTEETKEETTTDSRVAGVDLGGVAIDLSARFIPFHFDGGKIFITAGIDSRINLMKDFIVKRNFNKEVELNEGGNVTTKRDDATLDKVTGDDAKKAISMLNVAGKLSIGASFLDDMIGVAFIGRYWFSDQVDNKEAGLKAQDLALRKLSSVGTGFDFALGVNINFMPMFA